MSFGVLNSSLANQEGNEGETEDYLVFDPSVNI